MNLTISAEGFELTSDIKDIVKKKFVNKISKFLKRYPEDSVTTHILLSKGDRWGFKAHCEMDLPGANIHSEETHKELASAIVAMADEVERLLLKKKEKDLKK